MTTAGPETSAWRHDALLLLAAMIWGFAFVAQRAGMQHLGPLAFNGIRFAIGAVVILPVVVARGGLASHGSRREGQPARLPPKAMLLIGGVLFVAATLQQYGVVYTTAGKAGFITGLYVIVVPLLGLVVGQRVPVATWCGAGLAVVGMYLLSFGVDLEVARGDLLCLLGAVFWALHVQIIGRLSRRHDPYAIACGQFAVCAVLSLIGALLLERTTWPAIRAAALPILYTGLLSVTVAYTLQVVAQRRAPPAHAAVILSLEAVFAVLGGWLALGETLALRALLGCATMLAGMLLSQLAPRRGPRSAERPDGTSDGTSGEISG